MTANSGFSEWWLTCFYNSLLQGSCSVFQMNICAPNTSVGTHKNQQLRKDENRYIKK